MGCIYGVGCCRMMVTPYHVVRILVVRDEMLMPVARHSC